MIDGDGVERVWSLRYRALVRILHASHFPIGTNLTSFYVFSAIVSHTGPMIELAEVLVKSVVSSMSGGQAGNAMMNI